MQRYCLILTKAASRQLAKLQKGDASMYRRIEKALRSLRDDPRNQEDNKDITSLKGAEGYRMRVGGYRILYSLQEDQLVIEVFRLGPRGDIYK